MSVTVVDAPGGRFLDVAGMLARRSLRAIRRLPAAFIPSLVMPVFLTISFSGAYGGFVRDGGPGFPTHDPLSWFVPQAAVQAAAFGGMGIAFGAIRDLESGFFDRLIMAPISPWGLLVGPLSAGAVRAMVPVALVTAVGLLGGMEVPGGPAAFVMMAVVAVGIGVVAGLWGLGLAYRIRSMGAAALMQFGIFFLIFLSEAQVPVGVMQGWLKPVATWNPLTRILRMARSGFVGDVTWAVVGPGLAALAGFVVITAVFAATGLRRIRR